MARLDDRGGVVRAESTQHAENAANAAAVDELLAAVPIVGTQRSKEVQRMVAAAAASLSKRRGASGAGVGPRLADQAWHAKGARMIFVLDDECIASALPVAPPENQRATAAAQAQQLPRISSMVEQQVVSIRCSCRKYGWVAKGEAHQWEPEL